MPTAHPPQPPRTGRVTIAHIRSFSPDIRRRRFLEEGADLITFTSSSTVENFLALGLIWAYVFLLLELTVPGALHFPDPAPGLPSIQRLQADVVYFSFATLTTLGYGDIVPVDPFARSLANLESIIGQFYLAITVARLVTLELADRRR